MADDDKIKIELEIPRWCLEALARWKIPEDHCGASIEERIAWLVDEQAVAITEAERKAQKAAPTITPPRFLQ